jgi:hypothetical protein
MFIAYTSPWSRFELTILVAIGTDYTGSCKSNYHMITAKMAPVHKILIKHKIWPILINYLLLHVSVKFKEEYIIFIITRIH